LILGVPPLRVVGSGRSRPAMPSSTKVPGGSPKGSPKVGRSPHDVDYAEEGRKLLAQMNLSEADGFGAKRSAKISTMYKHPDGGGVL